MAAISSLDNSGTLVDELGGYGTAKNGKINPVVWVQGSGGTWTSFNALPTGGISGAIVAADPADGSARFGGSVITKTSKKQYHAAFWNNPVAGTPNFTDLHPVGKKYVASSVYCESGAFGFQGGAVLVGTAKASLSHAMVWDGTAASAVDLQLLLPAGFVSSVVTGFDVYGNAEGSALDTGGVWHLVSWAYTAPAD